MAAKYGTPKRGAAQLKTGVPVRQHKDQYLTGQAAVLAAMTPEQRATVVGR